MKSSLRPDGQRPKIRIADVKGRFTQVKHAVFYVLMVIYAVIPFIKVDGRPLVFIDILNRQFYLLGRVYNAQDFYLVFFLITGVLFTLFFITALVGRVWCGWACPQTVFLEGVFRKFERWIEGSKSEQILLAASPLSKRLPKFVLKHGVYLVCALIISHIFLSYFVSLDRLVLFMQGDPREHGEAFLWMAVVTGIIYFNFAWFREQLCLIVCPYGRIQSTLTDDDTLVIGYDVLRGEPRGKKNDPSRGACISCQRCVEVCPTSIDIRNGLQLECVGCANCIDACDEIMEKVGQSKGLIRYDSLNGLSGRPKKIIRPRILVYCVLLVIGMLVSGYFLSERRSFEANLLRSPGAPYLFENGNIRNQFTLNLVNKSPDPTILAIASVPIEGVDVIIPFKQISLNGLEHRQMPFMASMHHDAFKDEFQLEVSVTDTTHNESIVKTVRFTGPSKRDDD